MSAHKSKGGGKNLHGAKPRATDVEAGELAGAKDVAPTPQQVTKLSRGEQRKVDAQAAASMYQDAAGGRDPKAGARPSQAQSAMDKSAEDAKQATVAKRRSRYNRRQQKVKQQRQRQKAAQQTAADQVQQKAVQQTAADQVQQKAADQVQQKAAQQAAADQVQQVQGQQAQQVEAKLDAKVSSSVLGAATITKLEALSPLSPSPLSPATDAASSEVAVRGASKPTASAPVAPSAVSTTVPGAVDNNKVSSVHIKQHNKVKTEAVAQRTVRDKPSSATTVVTKLEPLRPQPAVSQSKSQAEASSVVQARAADAVNTADASSKTAATQQTTAAMQNASSVTAAAKPVSAADLPVADLATADAVETDSTATDPSTVSPSTVSPSTVDPSAVAKATVDALDVAVASVLESAAKQARDTSTSAASSTVTARHAEAAMADVESEQAAVVEAQPASAEAVQQDPNYNPKAPLRMPKRRVLANALRMLAVDAVELAQSGHPGMPMGMADIAEVLWRDFLRHNPLDPAWVNRDRFVLSNGHGSMLLYALLHLTGYDLSMDDLKRFRQLHSKTPGHPEVGRTPGVEASTGPLGQGLANAVGMALAQAQLAAKYNTADVDLIDHFTYVFAGDGCLMEGISHEACALAGTWGLGKLIVFWDDNGISIDGKTEAWFTENVARRFAAYGWQVIPHVDGHHTQQIRNAIVKAQADSKRPTLICCKTQIGYGAPQLANTAKVHGAPLGKDEIEAMREELKWNHKAFEIPQEVAAAWDNRAHGQRLQKVWQLQWEYYQAQHVSKAAALERRWQKQLPAAWRQQQDELLQTVQQAHVAQATRVASRHWLQQSAALLPELIGGAADVSDSVNTKWPGCTVMKSAAHAGNYIHYGVREFAMSAIMNGLALHGDFIPFGGTYLVFSDYARNAVRMAAMMQQRSIFIYSHDSLALGEDGPTHQPIEHLASLRLIPNLDVWRPADTAETAVAWRCAIERSNGPSCLVLSRQKLKHLQRSEQQLAAIARGAYVIYQPAQAAAAIILATGSEVQLAVAVAQQLEQRAKPVRVVSIPCVERFMQQDKEYQLQVMAPQLQQRIAIECGSSDYWYQFVGAMGLVIGVDNFGESAPGSHVMDHYGFNQEQIMQQVEAYLSK